MRWRVRLQVRYRRRTDLVLTALALAAVLAGLMGTLLWSPEQAVASPTQTANTIPLHFYLTPDSHQGDQVLTACASGYHMASLWEIVDTSNLRYNTSLGATRPDSGHGPPAAGGWIRTGYDNGAGGAPGTSNCDAWTSNSGSAVGTNSFLPDYWTTGVEDIMGWGIGTAVCSLELPVWCVGVSTVYLPLILRAYSG